MTAAPQSCQPGAAPVRQHTPMPWHQGIEQPTTIWSGKTISSHAVAMCHHGQDYISLEQCAANAAFIVEAVNSHATLLAHIEELTKALALARNRIDYLGEFGHARHRKHNETEIFPAIDRALAMPLEQSGSGK